MPPVVSRILASVFMIPLAALVYIVTFVFAERAGPHDEWAWTLGGLVTWIALALAMWLIWRSSLSRTRGRVISTLMWAIASVLAGVVSGFITDGILRDSDLGGFIGSTIAPIVWLIAMTFVWRDSPAEYVRRTGASAKPVVCPTCKYNMTGLTEARCPECGAAFTLDQLYAAQSDGSSAAMNVPVTVRA